MLLVRSADWIHLSAYRRPCHRYGTIRISTTHRAVLPAGDFTNHVFVLCFDATVMSVLFIVLFLSSICPSGHGESFQETKPPGSSFLSELFFSM